MNDSTANTILRRPSGIVPAPKMTPAKAMDGGSIAIYAQCSAASGYVHFYGGSEWPSGGGLQLVANIADSTQWYGNYWDSTKNTGYFGTWFGDWAASAWMSWAQGGGALPPGQPVQARYWASSVAWELKSDGGLYVAGTTAQLRYYPQNTYFTYTLNSDGLPLTCKIMPV
jgi:hypothetical protein